MIKFMWQKQRFKFFPTLLMIVSLSLGLMRFNSLQVGASYDDAHYIILAESIASGQRIGLPLPHKRGAANATGEREQNRDAAA